MNTPRINLTFKQTFKHTFSQAFARAHKGISLYLCMSLGLALLHILAGVQPVAAAGAQPPTAKAALYMPKVSSGKIAVAMSAGNSHTCALQSGALFCWGLNGSGQLGDGTMQDRLAPVAVEGLESGVTAISAAFDYSCAVVNGGVMCWGSNSYGELGDGTNLARATPAAVSGLESGMKAVAAGYFHACAVADSGKVKCWGNNQSNRLGDGTTFDSLLPVNVVGLNNAKALVAGWGHTCALTSAGGVKCWGSNASGQLGDGTTEDRATPVAVAELASGVIALSAGDSHTCALLSGGSVKCWGFNGSGQLGDDGTHNWPAPGAVIGLNTGVVAITSSYGHSCALLQSGSVKCWGYNETGQLGDSTITYRTSPVEVAGVGSGMIALAAGWGHSCVLSDGGAQCWGRNDNGQLGDDTTTFSPTPVNVIWP